ncbi:hypothetical protein ACOANM_29280 [Pseudomonas aeruginosa]|uniref:hypothetical protein n=1 Tax=Pseudomonas aeruginosa TaxID=287 RepID=UPI000B1E0FA8|nr:hypothetical protein [Pseudomonas aeruginosa]WHV52084.1 hypothetical protein M2I92_03520 [Pseudomonas aeruginosa]WNZ18799.1 hypothetical protein QJQ47_03495 [Pseudomonas aeruginosa]
MNETNTYPTETTESCSGSSHADTGTSDGFTPLHSSDPLCIIGYPSNTAAPDLYDAATHRHSAVLGVLCVLSSAPDLNELSTSSLQNCIQAIRILSEDAAALYAGAWQALRKERY